MKSVLIAIVGIFFFSCLSFTDAGQNLRVITVNGVVSNSYIVYDSNNEAVLIDTGLFASFLPGDGTAIQAALNAASLDLVAIYITHPHPDHFAGVVPLSALYSGVPVYVLNNFHKQAIIATVAATATLFGTAYADFDWAGTLTPLPNATIIDFLNLDLDIVSNFLPNEADLSSIVVDATSKTLIAGDLIYVDHHLFLGPLVDATKIGNWKNILTSLAATYTATPPYTVYPGHGGISTTISTTVTAQIGYLDFFLATLCEPGVNITNVRDRLIAQYPTYEAGSAVNVLDFIAQNTAWQDYIDACPGGGVETDNTSAENEESSNSSMVLLHSSSLFLVCLLLTAFKFF